MNNHLIECWQQQQGTSWVPDLPAWLLTSSLARTLWLAMKSIRGERQVAVVDFLVELLSQQHEIVLHLSDQRVSFLKLLLKIALFLSQVYHFFGCHVSTVFGSGLVGKPFSARKNLHLLF